MAGLWHDINSYSYSIEHVSDAEYRPERCTRITSFNCLNNLLRDGYLEPHFRD